MQPQDQSLAVPPSPSNQEAQDEAQHLAQGLHSLLNQFLATGKTQAARAIDEVAKAAEQMGKQLRSDQQSGLADSVDRLAQQLHQFTTNMQQQSLERTIHDIEQAAEKHRTFLVAGGLLLGLLAAKIADANRQK
jgi:CHASE3 domain sensor protein